MSATEKHEGTDEGTIGEVLYGNGVVCGLEGD